MDPSDDRRCGPIKQVVAGAVAVFLLTAFAMGLSVVGAAITNRHWTTAIMILVPGLSALSIVLAFATVAIKGYEPVFLANDN